MGHREGLIRCSNRIPDILTSPKRSQHTLVPSARPLWERYAHANNLATGNACTSPIVLQFTCYLYNCPASLGAVWGKGLFLIYFTPLVATGAQQNCVEQIFADLEIRMGPALLKTFLDSCHLYLLAFPRSRGQPEPPPMHSPLSEGLDGSGRRSRSP